MTEYERWNKLRSALRLRLSQYQLKEDKVSDEMSKSCCRYAQMTIKDVIRIMTLLEEKLCFLTGG